MIRPLFLLILLLAASWYAQAAEVPSIHYTVKDGLPSNMVYDVYQDDKGYIWLATDKGISVYNGLTFRNYTTNNGLSDNECFFFRKDLYGRLWISTYNGSLMYYQDGIFHTAANTPFLQLPFNKGITHTIIPEADSSVTILFNNRNKLVSVGKDRVHTYSLKPIETDPSTTMMFARKSGRYTYDIHYTRTPYKITIDTNCHILDSREKDSRYFPVQTVTSSHNEVYLISDTAIYHLDRSLFKKLPPGFATHNIIRWVFDHPDGTLIGTHNGLFINGRLFLKDKNISSFFRDSDGNFWIGTLNDGIYKLNAALFKSIYLADCYQKPVVYTADIKQGDLLVGTFDGNVYRLYHDSILPVFNIARDAPGNTPLAESAHFWDGRHYFSFGQNLNEKAGQNRMLEQVTGQVKISKIDVPLFFTSSIIANQRYLYFIGGRRAIIYSTYDAFLKTKKTGQRFIFSTNYNDEVIINSSCKAPDSSVWFSTIKHVYHITDTIVRQQPQFRSFAFKAMIINRNCMVGNTFDNKLVICNQYTGSTINFDTTVGNQCLWNKFYTINDSIVLATTNNLYRLIITHPSVGKPVFEIRIPEQQFIPQLAEHIYSDGENCYFFKDHSITRLPLSNLLENVSLPTVAFSQITTADSNTLQIDSNISLPYNKAQNISIGFTALSLNIEDLSYEYAISQGNDTGNWIRSNGENINLYKLGSGTYNISIRARTPGGNYSLVRSFTLSVGRPFWLSWWFLLIDAAIIGSATWLLVKYYTRKATARKEEELQQKEQEMKFLKSEYKALNALMNPHFIFNTLNSVQSLINKDDKQASSEHIRTVADLIRQNMHNVAQDQITLEEELTLVINYLKLEQLRFNWLHFELHIDDAIDTDDIMVPPLILQPLVENAILHGLWPARLQQGIINIQVMKKEKSIIINITDNGKGFSNNANKDRNPNHKSTAVHNISSRMQQLSAMHGKSYTFHIEELKTNGEVSGVRATIEIEL